MSLLSYRDLLIFVSKLLPYSSNIGKIPKATVSGFEFVDVDANLNTKVDKVTGKGLSTNDLTNDLKSNYDTAYSNSHSHSNKTSLDKISQDESGEILYNGNHIRAYWG